MKYSDLECAFETVSSASQMGDYAAFVSRATGEILYDMDEAVMGEPRLPESIYEDENYVAVPDRMDLGLGTNLVWEFVRQEVPALEPKVRAIFSRKGAYRRYKDFLQYNGMLDRWYAFENERQQEALLSWCAENGIEVDDQPSATMDR